MARFGRRGVAFSRSRRRFAVDRTRGSCERHVRFFSRGARRASRTGIGPSRGQYDSPCDRPDGRETRIRPRGRSNPVRRHLGTRRHPRRETKRGAHPSEGEQTGSGQKEPGTAQFQLADPARVDQSGEPRHGRRFARATRRRTLSHRSARTRPTRTNSTVRVTASRAVPDLRTRVTRSIRTPRASTDASPSSARTARTERGCGPR